MNYEMSSSKRRKKVGVIACDVLPVAMFIDNQAMLMLLYIYVTANMDNQLV